MVTTACSTLLLLFFFAETPTLTQAQVILNGLNSLFEAVETQTLSMLDQVEEIVVPDEWRNTDLVKQTKEVMVSIYLYILRFKNQDKWIILVVSNCTRNSHFCDYNLFIKQQGMLPVHVHVIHGPKGKFDHF